MGLFDNIFLDKDTPTALLDNPEIKPPAGTPKKEEAVAPYDPKNDPIAPAIDATAELDTTGAPATDITDVSFDIGGDLDFGTIGTDAPATDTITAGTEETEKEGEKDGFTVSVGGETTHTEGTDGNVSSIAMIQGGTASIVEGIDIGGISPSTDTSIADVGSTGSAVDIEIHDIEDHQVGDASEIGNGESGIYGFMEKSMEVTPDAPTGESVATPTEEVISIQTADPIQIDSLAQEDALENPLSILADVAKEVTPSSQRGGKIQELIEKLITELRTLDEEEHAMELERQAKIESISKREQELEHEYLTRKEALKYERASIEQGADKTIEKERIKSLISSFQEDLG